MTNLTGKIDFIMLLTVSNANPNGNPLNGNRPRETNDGYGEISSECVKRKIRNRWMDMNEEIFVQPESRSMDGFKNLKQRADGFDDLKEEMKLGKKADPDKCREIACRKWLDVRSFGQVFAFSGDKFSLGVRGPVSLCQTSTVCPIETYSMQITKCTNSEDKVERDSSTMGMRHMVRHGLYIVKGCVNVQLAEITGFSQEDAELLKKALLTLFENDASAARPEGSMEVCQLYWWQHKCKTPAASTAKIHRSLEIVPKTEFPSSFADYEINFHNPEGCVEPEIISLV